MSNPALQVYGGDEVSAVIIDPGSFTTNIGYSGMDCPQLITPSNFGYYNNDSSKLPIFNEQSIGFPREDYEIGKIVENGEIINWDMAEKQWDWSLKNQLKFETNKGLPALLTEPIWNHESNRKRSLEIMLESMQFEACYLVPNSTSVSFAMGKPTCLVVDIGHDVTSVSPVIDGMTLSKSSTRNFIAGKLLNELIKDNLSPRELLPIFQISQKYPKLIRKEFKFTVDNSLIEFANERQFLQECKETLCQVSPVSLSKFTTELDSIAKRSIESPWGEELIFKNYDRYRFSEQLFKPEKSYIPDGWPLLVNSVVEAWHNDYIPLKRAKPIPLKEGRDEIIENTPIIDGDEPSMAPVEPLNENGKRFIETDLPNIKSEIFGLADLIHSSIVSTDVDLRSTLAHNIIITGGTSAIPGLSDRIMSELNKSLPALKFRILASGHLKERQYHSWLGGSILASLGTFHQLWVGKQEYDEVGADRLLRDRFR